MQGPGKGQLLILREVLATREKRLKLEAALAWIKGELENPNGMDHKVLE
jgi:hypothetical protein